MVCPAWPIALSEASHHIGEIKNLGVTILSGSRTFTIQRPLLSLLGCLQGCHVTSARCHLKRIESEIATVQFVEEYTNTVQLPHVCSSTSTVSMVDMKDDKQGLDPKLNRQIC